MQNIMRIARALSRRRKDSIALEVGDMAEAFCYVDFVDRRSLASLCRWLSIDAAQFREVRAGGLSLVKEGAGLLIPLSQEMRTFMDVLPISLDNIVGQPSDGDLDAQAMARWVLAEDLLGQYKPKAIMPASPAVPAKAAFVVPEVSKPQSLADRLRSVIYGQDDILRLAVDAVGNRDAATAGLPLTFFAAGPASSGKTLLANQLAAALPGYVCRSFEMSTYTSYNDFGLTGLRYGYSDAHPGELTSFVRHNPQAIIIFENVDRAHPNIQNSLVPAVSRGVLRDQYWAGLADRGPITSHWQVDSGMFGSSKKDTPPGVADPDVRFGECILVFTSSQGEAAHDLPLYNDRSRMVLSERTGMLLDVLRGQEGVERALVPALLNALAESVVLPFRRLDTTALLQIARARLRDAADRWRSQHKVGLRIEQFEVMAELFLLSQGGRISPRTLTTRAAENFLFAWYDKPKMGKLSTRVVLAADMKQSGGYPAARQPLGDDPVLSLFRKHQSITFASQVEKTADGTRVQFGDFRLETIRRAGDFGGQGGLQVEMPAVCFDDVVGHSAIKLRFKQIIRLLGQQDTLASLGVGVPRGMMLYGPPGTGKTMLAKAFSHEADLPFVAVTGTELMDIEFIRKLFLRLRRYAPAVLFIDEIDAIGRRGQSALGDAVINQVLAEIDGFAGAASEPLFVIAATNYPEKLDVALLRSGRIDLHVEVPTLDDDARRLFLDRYRAIPGLAEIDVERALAVTSNLSGADLEKGRREIVLEMARSDRSLADEALLFSKLAEIKHGEMRDIECSDEELERNAFHEAGHAVIAQLLLPEQRIERVSIEIRGETVGGVSFVGGKSRVDNLDASLVRKRLCMMLAGRLAEMKRFGEAGCNAGAASDLRQANELAGRAVMCWGLDRTVGLLSFSSTDGALPALANAPAWAVERIRAWLDQAADDTQQLLDEHWLWVQAVAARLMAARTLGMTELAAVRDGLTRSVCY